MKYFILVFILDILYLLVKLILYVWRERHEDYFQTGFYVVKLDKFHKKLIQFLCGIITKHPPSATEWGYGGGDYADRWCRWCDKQYQVPKESVYFTHHRSKDIMKTVGKELDSE